MFRKFLYPWFVLTLVSLLGCTPMALNPYPGAITPENNSNGTSTMRPLPTLPGGTPNPLYSYYATPAFTEKVVVENIHEIILPVPDQHYGLERTADQLYVVDSQTQERFPLGDATGSAYFQERSAKTLLWFFACSPCSTLATGIYAYSFETHQNQFVTDQGLARLGALKIADPWLLYMWGTPDAERMMQLYAYHLSSQEKVLIAKNLFFDPGVPHHYLAINEEMVAWVEGNDVPPIQRGIHVYDLTTRTTRSLEVENVGGIRNLAVSRNLVVWWDVFWQGYDLDNEARFTIPLRPTGWENKPFNEKSIAAVGRQIQWTLESNGESHTFVGTVEIKAP